jgi:hypothetical protein
MRGAIMKPKLVCAIGATVLVVGIIFLGCSKQRVSTVSYTGLTDAHLETIGVLPFFVGRHPTNMKETMNCKLCELSFNPDDVSLGADRTLTRYLQEGMDLRYGDRVLPQSVLLHAYNDISKDDQKDTPVSLAKNVGEAVAVKHIVIGTVWRYKERVGSSGGATRPASVAFDVYLMDVASGALLWMASFDETQRSLSENVLDLKAFFSRGAKWLTANELARYGVKEIINQFPL